MSFKSLVNVVSEQRQEIKQALQLFPYFETWEPELVAECCRVSSVVEFSPDEIISGPDIGNSHAVYFILEGVCKIIKNLFLIMRGLSYKLQEHFPSEYRCSELKNEGYASRLFKNQNFWEKANSVSFQMKRNYNNLNESSSLHAKVSNNETRIGGNVSTEAKSGNQTQFKISLNREPNKEILAPLETVKSDITVEVKSKKCGGSKASEDQEETTYDAAHYLMVLEECRKRREDLIRVFKKTTAPEKPKNTKCVFIQIGFLSRGACFGLDKSQNDSFMMTATRVKCLKIPLRFLLEHNPRNIWNRIRLFQSLHLPNEEKVFEYFRFNRMWLERRKTQTAKIISLKSLPRNTLASEVPYSIRLTYTP